MRRLLLTSLSPLALLAGEAAHAQTVVSTSTTGNVQTSTAGDVTVDSAGTIAPAAGAAITIDSLSAVSNAGAITFTDIDNATGIAAAAGQGGSLASSGTITVTESDTSSDTDSDGDDDTPLAVGSNRYGIHALGSYAGPITASGTITVIGNDSAGIAVDGTLGNTLASSGTITVTGTDSYGIHTQGVLGDVALSGTITATGERATGVAIDGDVTGAVTVAGTIASTGFRSTSADTTLVDADDLLVGGAALQIGGSVAGGVHVLLDDTLGTGIVTSYGSAPALLIGSSGATVIGTISGTSTGVAVDGDIYSYGTYAGFDATALQIGGTGGSVDVTGGVAVSGLIGATSGTGVTSATGILIGSGATVTSLSNSGTISATSLGNEGTTTAIADQSGTLASLTNTGAISATLASGYVAGQSIAIDLSANTGGVTITQAQSSVTDAATPSIAGDILTGSGNDLIDIQAGTTGGAITLGAGADTLRLSSATVVGAVDFGDGANTLSLSGTSALTGDLSFGADDSRITLADTAVYTGTVTQGTGLLSLSVQGGTFAAANTGTLHLSDLTLGATGALAVNIDTAAGTSTAYTATGAATIAAGAKLNVTLSNFIGEEADYRVITAGTLSGGSNLSLTTTTLPYLYSATLAASDAAGTVDLDLRRKTATELGLNRSGTAAYDAIYAAIPTDAAIESVFLGITDAAGFASAYSSFLPDDGSGAFLAAMGASRAVATMAADPATPRTDGGRLGMWLGELAHYLDKPAGTTTGYQASSWGLAAGLDYRLPIGTFGVSFASVTNTVGATGNDNEVLANQTEFGGYWHASWKGLRANARAAISTIAFTSARFFTGTYGSTEVSRTSNAEWSGTMKTAGGGASYEFGRKWFVRPGAAIDYFKLDENAHAETGGGTAFDLSVAKRNSDQLAAAFTLAAGMRLGSSEDFALRVEVEGGQREVLSGAVGATTASFTGGQSFTITPDALVAGPMAKLRLSGGNDLVTVSGELSAEGMQHEMALGAHVGLKLKL